MPVVVITGGSVGIGAALARELSGRGYAVGLIARRGDLLEALVKELITTGAKAAWVAADVTDRAQVDTAITTLTDQLGPVDLLIANAGTAQVADSATAPVDAWMKVLTLNINGVIYATGAVIPSMVARGSGHLVVVSSLAGTRGLPRNGAYSASKAAVSTFFEALRNDLRRHGIAVTTIHPGFIKTPLTDKNRHPMPFLMPVERAAKIIADGLAARRSEINFPWQMRWILKLARILPNWLWDRVAIGIG